MPSNRSFGLVRSGHGGNEIVLRLHVVGGLDHEQRLSLGNGVARPRQQFGDPAGIGRKHRRRAVLVDRDLAFGDMLFPEGALGDRLDGQAGPFGRGRGVALQPLAGLAGHLRMALACSGNMQEPKQGRARKHQQRRGNGQLLPGKHLQSLDKPFKHGA